MKPQKGFNLIELIIAVSIVGILAAIAYPSYLRHIVDSRRVDAMAYIEEAANLMERHFTLNGNYNEAEAGETFPSRIPFTGDDVHYRLTLSLIPATDPRTGFRILAIPQNTSTQKENGVIDIDHTGLRRWDENNDGSFSDNDNNWTRD